MTVGRILANDKDKGSGFALATPHSGSTRVVLTANHVVGNQEASSLQFVTQDGQRIPVERVERDDDLDIAVLHLGEDVPEGLAVGRAIEGDSLAGGDAAARQRSDANGHYNRHAPPIRKAGRGRHEIYVLQLQVDQNLDDYKGYSGSPVVLKSPSGAVIGVMS